MLSRGPEEDTVHFASAVGGTRQAQGSKSKVFNPLVRVDATIHSLGCKRGALR